MLPSCLRGRLLVAAPPLVDPNFDRTVVLVLEHGPDGALGIVLNRPTTVGLDDSLPDWESAASEPAVVFEGGPVAPDAVIALARASEPVPPEGWVPVLDDLGTVDLARPPSAAATLTELRVFVGYAGWAPGQLEGEIDEGAWFVVSARPGDAFSPEPADLWRAVLRRQRSRVAMFANCPEDASVN